MAQKRSPSGATPAEPVARKAPAPAAEPVQPTEAAAPAERLQPAAPVSSVAEAAAVAPAARSELVGAIARRLRTGELTVQQAVEELIEDTVRSNLGQGPSDAPLAKRLREALRA